MMELLYTLNADNGQIFLWIGLVIGLVSRGSFLVLSTWQVVTQVSFLSFLFSLEDALFLLCPWFSHEVFYTVMSFNEASEDTGYHCFLLCCCLLLCWTFPFLFLSCVPLHLPYEGKCQNNGRPEMTVRRRRPEMTDRRRHVRR